MEKTVHYLETHSQNPYYNLAFEEYVLCHRTEGDYLLLWQNDNTIVVGRNQNTEAEINRAFVEEHHINVVRRGTGGGAVYHDLGNLNYSFITDVGDDGISIRRFTQPVVAALRSLGLNAEASGRNDILVEGRKVSGTAQRRHAGRILHHGTLLFDANPGMVAGALNVDPEKFRSKSTKSVRARIGNIRDFLPVDMDLPAFWTYLKDALSGGGLTRRPDCRRAGGGGVPQDRKIRHLGLELRPFPQVRRHPQALLGRRLPGGQRLHRRWPDHRHKVLRRLPGRPGHGRPAGGAEGHRLPPGGRPPGAGGQPRGGAVRCHHGGRGHRHPLRPVIHLANRRRV